MLLVLPYSLVGPFAGVFLDRWRRQRVLSRGAVVHGGVRRSVGGVARNHGLTVGSPSTSRRSVRSRSTASTSRPRARRCRTSSPSDQLVARQRVQHDRRHGRDDPRRRHRARHPAPRRLRRPRRRARRCGGSFVGYLAAAAVAARLPVDSLGPHDASVAARSGRSSRAVAAGFVAGRAPRLATPARGSRARRDLRPARAVRALDDHDAAALPQHLPRRRAAARRAGRARARPRPQAESGWCSRPLVTPRVDARGSACADGSRSAPRVPAVSRPGAGHAVPTAALSRCQRSPSASRMQATKVCVDTIVQETVDDDFRGRAFAIYDAGSNMCFAALAVVACLRTAAEWAQHDHHRRDERGVPADRRDLRRGSCRRAAQCLPSRPPRRFPSSPVRRRRRRNRRLGLRLLDGRLRCVSTDVGFVGFVGVLVVEVLCTVVVVASEPAFALLCGRRPSTPSITFCTVDTRPPSRVSGGGLGVPAPPGWWVEPPGEWVPPGFVGGVRNAVGPVGPAATIVGDCTVPI